MASDASGNDFFLEFGSDAAPFGEKLAADLTPGIESIQRLRAAMEQYEAVSDRLKGSPASISFAGLDQAASRMESATADFTRTFGAQMEQLFARINLLAETLASGARYAPVGVTETPVTNGRRRTTPVAETPVASSIEPFVPRAYPPRPKEPPTEPLPPILEANPPPLEPKAGSSEKLWDRYYAKLEALNATPGYQEANAAYNAAVQAEAVARQKFQQELDQWKRAKVLIDQENAKGDLRPAEAQAIATGNAANPARSAATQVSDQDIAAARAAARASESPAVLAQSNSAIASEVQIGNTPANPVPVVIVGAEGQAGLAHGGKAAQTPTKTATTATQTAKALDEVNAIAAPEVGARASSGASLAQDQEATARAAQIDLANTVAALRLSGSKSEPVAGPRRGSTAQIVEQEAATAAQVDSAVVAAANSTRRSAEQWESLSASYRRRLERAGVTQEQYASGASLAAARGHAAELVNQPEVEAATASVAAQLNAEASALGRARRIGGGFNPPPPPPTPPAPPAAPEPEEPEEVRPSTVRRGNGRYNLADIGSGERDLTVDANRQEQFAKLDAQTQSALGLARQELARLALENQSDSAVLAEQRDVIARAGGAFKSDPAIRETFNSAAHQGSAFMDFLGINPAASGNIGFIQKILSSRGLSEDYVDRDRQDQLMRALGLGGAGKVRTPSSRSIETPERSGEFEARNAENLARYQEILAQGVNKVTIAQLRKAQAQTEVNRLEAQGIPDAEAYAAAQLRLAQASTAAANAQLEQVMASQPGSRWQQFTGQKSSTSFAQDMRKHLGNALTNTIGYTLAFTGFEKLREVVHTGLEADAAFVRLQASLDANGISAGNLSTDLARISATTATPLEHVIEAASELAGTFKSAGDIAFATNIAAQLANISQGTLTAKEAAVGLRDVVSAFGQDWVTSSDVARKKIQETGDQIAHLSQLTGVSIKDITEGTTQIAQEAHDFGLNQRQSATLAAYVTQGTGESGEQAAAQTSRLLATLYRGQTQTELIKLGVATPAEFSSGKIGDILTNLIGKYHELNASSRAAIAALMGTGIQARAFAALMNGGTAAVKELNGTFDDTGALAKQNQAYLNTVAGSIKQLSEDFQNLGSTLAHLGAFDAIGILANQLDKLAKGFNRSFGEIAAIMNSNPITGAMLHYTTVILEAAAAWRIFGAAATTALVRSGAVTAAQVGVQARNAGEIRAAEEAVAAGNAGVIVPAAKYERAAFGTLFGATASNLGSRAKEVGQRDVRTFLPGGASPRAVFNENLDAAKESEAAASARVTEMKTLEADAIERKSAVDSEAAGSEQALADANAELLAATEARIAAEQAATTATATRAEVEAAGIAGAGAGRLGSLGALGALLNRSFLLKAGVAVGTGMFLWNEMGGAGRDSKSRNAAADRIFRGSVDQADYNQTVTRNSNLSFAQRNEELGPIAGFSALTNRGFRDYYFGNSNNKFEELGHGLLRTGEGVVDQVGNLLTGGKFNLGGGGNYGYASDKSSNEFLNLDRREFDQGVVKDLPKLKSVAAVKKWLDEQDNFIKKHKGEIEKAGGNNKAEQGQIAFNINELQANLGKAATNRIAALEGLKNIDVLNSVQAQNVAAAAAQIGQLSKESLRTQKDAVQEIISSTGAPLKSSEYKNLQIEGDPNASRQERLKAQLAVDSATLKSVSAQLASAGKRNGIAFGTDQYKTLVQTRDQLLSQIESAQQATLQEPIQVATGLASIDATYGNTSGAVAQMRSAISRLRGFNSKLDHDNPQFVQNLQQIQQLEQQIAQTASLPQLYQAQLAAVSNDPITQAKANLKAADIQLAAAKAAYHDEYVKAMQAYNDAKIALDNFLTQQGDQWSLGSINQLNALTGAKTAAGKNIPKGTSPLVQQEQLAHDQQVLTAANSAETLKEAQYAAKIASIRNSIDSINAQINGVLAEEVRYSKGKIKSKQKEAELQSQQTQLEIQKRDALEAQRESVLTAASALAKFHGDDVAAAADTLKKAQEAYNYALSQYKRGSQQVNDALAQLYQTRSEFYATQLAQEQSDVDLQIAQLQARGKEGDIPKAAQLEVQKAKNAINKYLAHGGKKGTSEYNQLLGQLATARRQAFDTALQAQLDTLDFERETYHITSSEEIKSLQEILKNKRLTLQEQRDITLKIKSLQEDIRNQLTQGGFNIPSDIKLPTAYEVRRSLGAGFGGSGTTAVQTNTVNNNQQVTVHNNVPTKQVADQIAREVINLLNRQTGSQSRATTSTPRLVPTR